MYKLKNDTVKQMKEINLNSVSIFSVPDSFLKEIKRNGRAHLRAILMLTDLIRRFQPIEVQKNGKIEYKQQFKHDKLAIKKERYQDMFDVKSRTINKDLRFLEDQELIEREIRTISNEDELIYHAIFVDLNLERIKEIIY